MYNHDYGYRTGINQTMTNHVGETVRELSSRNNFLNKKDFVLDIASNDGTLLNFYNKNLNRIGIDPTIAKYKRFYRNINHKLSTFFSKKELTKIIKKKKIKAITALSVFYDLKDPNKFLKEISEIIDTEKGIFVLEHTDLLSIIKNNLFDTICHEHLAYYSAKVIMKMISENNLKVFDISRNQINGGSTRFYICHKKSNYSVKKNKINQIIKYEKKFKLEQKNTYIKFFEKILSIKKNLNSRLKKIKENGKIIHGYGASTKGNVLLQFFEIDKNMLNLIADRNPLKFNYYTPGTKIIIKSEKYSRSLKPDFYLVLPWHFKKEIMKREKKVRSMGTKFIFPLPNIEVR
tara:strand:+ start:84 stop:1124 length:1041 start_codon:yes stop_codon:yes gene_type:complete